MTDDELRARLARIDPVRRPESSDVLAATTAEQIRERAMQTIDTATTDAAASTRSPWRRPAVVLGAAASVAVTAVAAAVLTRDGGAPAPDRAPTVLTLQAPAGGPVMSSCLAFEVAILRDMPVAFAGTVTAIGADSVTLDVDRWYKGGTADQVTVANPTAGTPVSLEGVEFVEGNRYLVTATDGTVNLCGYSGPATPALERSFAEAFAGQ